jgi:hypothetical protein
LCENLLRNSKFWLRSDKIVGHFAWIPQNDSSLPMINRNKGALSSNMVPASLDSREGINIRRTRHNVTLYVHFLYCLHCTSATNGSLNCNFTSFIMRWERWGKHTKCTVIHTLDMSPAIYNCSRNFRTARRSFQPLLKIMENLDVFCVYVATSDCTWPTNHLFRFCLRHRINYC